MENSHSLTENNDHKDLLSEDIDLHFQFEYASQGQRFLNYLVDNLLMNYGLSYLTGMAIGAIIGILSQDFLQTILSGENKIGFYFLAVLIAYLNYLVYYTLCEKLFHGYTLGKLITGTRAIRQDGQELSFKDALLRSLCRLVPFEVLSGFSTLTWHDDWTKTMVIKTRK